MSCHAEQRLLEREPALRSLGPTLFPTLRTLASDGRSRAVRLASLGSQRGNYLTSSGDTLWAVLRGGSVVTVMRRRSTQPSTPAAFGVDEIRWSLVDTRKVGG